jgi:hypothetical protein
MEKFLVGAKAKKRRLNDGDSVIQQGMQSICWQLFIIKL